jgi:hypothetical protein
MAEEREIIYPDVEKAQVLGGEPGTEMILVLGGSGADVLEQVQRRWDGGVGEAPWPGLPPGTVIHLTADRVAFEGDRARDLGEIRDRPDPQERICSRLEEFRKRLREKWAFFEGLAFGHE